MRFDTPWQDARDGDTLSNEQAEAYCVHSQQKFSEIARALLQRLEAEELVLFDADPLRKYRQEQTTLKVGRMARKRNKIIKSQPVEKECTKCHEVKLLNQFYSGRNVCRGCYSVKRKGKRPYKGRT